MSRTTVQATCAATIRLRVRRLSRVPAARVEFACSAACGATRRECREGNMPKMNCRCNRQASAKEEDRQAYPHLIETRDISRRQCDQQPHAAEGKRCSGRAAGKRQHQALGETRPHQLAAACAQRGAHSSLAFRIDGARQLQIGKVDARDQQHRAHRRKQQPERAAHARGDILLQRRKRDSEMKGQMRGKRVRLLQGLQFSVRLGQRHAGLEPRDRLVVEVAHICIQVALARRQRLKEQNIAPAVS